MIRLTSLLTCAIIFMGATSTIGQVAENEGAQAQVPSGTIEYSAKFVRADGERGYFLQLVPLSEVAKEIDAQATEGLTDWVSQTSKLLREVSFEAETEFSARVASRKLLREAFTATQRERAEGWVETGLTLGYAPTGSEVSDETVGVADWSNGTAFVASGSFEQDYSMKGVVLANFGRDTLAGLDKARMREIARNAAEELFGSASESACSVIPRPAEISPSLAVSFNFFAGAEFSISATYLVDDLCKQLGLQ